MREQYPFFREEDERTQAVLGEDAAEADLNGEYQKPYAILTQKQLYCKNEAGNFIVPAANLRGAGTGKLPGQNWFLWSAVICAGLALVPCWMSALDVFHWSGLVQPDLAVITVCVVVCVILAGLKRIKAAIITVLATAGVGLFCSSRISGLYMMVFECFVGYNTWAMFVLIFPLVVLAAWWNRKKKVYQLIHGTGIFSFTPSLYPAAEWKHLKAQIHVLKAEDANGR